MDNDPTAPSNANDSVLPTRTNELPQIPLFLESFAAFLRQHRALWRTRRVDRFVPIDLDLADHHISIQGLINPEMLNAFLDRAGPLAIPPLRASRGDKVTLYVPAMSAPKRLLLQFSARSEVDEPLPVMSRTEGSSIAARDIVSQLLEKRVDPARPHLKKEDVVPLQLLVSALVFSNPHRLAARINTWPGRKYRVTRDRGLDPRDLAAWIKHEGDEFARAGGEALVRALANEITRAKDGVGPTIDPAVRRDGLAFFPTLRSLLIHGIQDLLKNLVQATDPWPPEGTGQDDEGGASLEAGSDGRAPLNARVLTVESFDDLAAQASAVLKTLDVLEELTQPDNQQDRTAIEELYLHLDRWTAYAVVDVELGVPFVMKFNQTLPLTPSTGLHEERWRAPQWWRRPLIWLDDRRRLWFTYHTYPLAPQDALSVHAEVVIDDPQLRMQHHTEVVTDVRPWTLRRRLLDGQRVVDRRRVIDVVYGHELRPTGRLLHRYSSRRPESYRITAPIFVRIRLKVIRSISRGYFFAALTFLLAGCYTAWIFLTALSHHTAVVNPDLPLTIAAVAATVSLWLTATQHPRPIVYRKLWLARRALYISLIAILVPISLYGARQAEPGWYHQSAFGLEWFGHRSWDHLAWTAIAVVALASAITFSQQHRRRGVKALVGRAHHRIKLASALGWVRPWDRR